MLPTAIPIVPFYVEPKATWHHNKERKERLSFDSESSEEEEEAPPRREKQKLKYNDEGSLVHSSMSGGGRDDDETLPDNEAMTRAELGNGVGQQPLMRVRFNINDIGLDKEDIDPNSSAATVIDVDPKIAELYEGVVPQEPINFFQIGPFYYAWRHFLRWKEGVKKRRMHYLVRNYYLKVLKHNAQVVKEKEEALAKKEAEMLLEAHRTEQRFKNFNFQKSRKYQAADYLTKAIDQRQKETERMEFNCYTFQHWAVENHDRKLREEEEERERLATEKRIKEEEDKIEAKRLERESDAAVLVQDVAITQDVVKSMRQAGVLPGVNVESKGNLLTEKNRNTKKYIELRIRKDIDFTKAGSRKQRSKEYSSPFDVDLSACRHVVVLKCFDIGELGAIALGGEIIRGAGNRLTTLDLSMCGIQTRGLGKLLYGIRVGGLGSLETLSLRHNFLTPRVFEMLKDCFKQGTFMNLKVLDLGYNEIGDDGVREMTNMLCHGNKYFQHIEQINLQANMITDAGFARMVKVVVNVKETFAPALTYLCLKNNPISGQVRVQYMPLPLYISI